MDRDKRENTHTVPKGCGVGVKMDFNVSRKETRYLPSGNVQVLMSSAYDLFPVLSDDGITILDVEILNDDRTELLDRAMWAAIKQYGLDPLNPTDGNQYEGVIHGETSVVALVSQIYNNVIEEGTGVTVTYETYIANGREYLTPRVMLTNAV